MLTRTSLLLIGLLGIVGLGICDAPNRLSGHVFRADSITNADDSYVQAWNYPDNDEVLRTDFTGNNGLELNYYWFSPQGGAENQLNNGQYYLFGYKPSYKESKDTYVNWPGPDGKHVEIYLTETLGTKGDPPRK